MSLKAYLFSEDVAVPVCYGTLHIASGIRVLFELPGGVLAIEFEIALSPIQSYKFFQDYLGYRIIIADHFCDIPVAEGWIFGIAVSKTGCRILCKGAWFRHFDNFDDTAYALTTTSSAIIKASLTGFVPVVSSDQTNIDETSFALDAAGTWDLSEYGLYPGDLITKLASMSNSDYLQWNYWIQSQPFNGTLPQAPIAYFEEQVNDGTYNWQINKSDLGGDGHTQERNIEELANEVLVIYRDIAGGTQALTAWSTDTTSQSTFWTKQIVLTGGEMVPLGATQYRDLMLSKLKDPLLKQSFTISSRGIRDNVGIRRPLWYPIKNGGGYLRFNNLDPNADIFTESVNRNSTGQIMTAEYDDTAHTLRVSLDTTDEGADALLAQISTFL